MILTALIIIFVALMNFVFGFLPSVGTLPDKISDGLQFIVDHAHGLDSILPVTEAFYIIKYSLLVFVVIQIWHIINFFVNKLRGSGSAG